MGDRADEPVLDAVEVLQAADGFPFLVEGVGVGQGGGHEVGGGLEGTDGRLVETPPGLDRERPGDPSAPLQREERVGPGGGGQRGRPDVGDGAGRPGRGCAQREGVHQTAPTVGPQDADPVELELFGQPEGGRREDQLEVEALLEQGAQVGQQPELLAPDGGGVLRPPPGPDAGDAGAENADGQHRGGQRQGREAGRSSGTGHGEPVDRTARLHRLLGLRPPPARLAERGDDIGAVGQAERRRAVRGEALADQPGDIEGGEDVAVEHRAALGRPPRYTLVEGRHGHQPRPARAPFEAGCAAVAGPVEGGGREDSDGGGVAGDDRRGEAVDADPGDGGDHALGPQRRRALVEPGRWGRRRGLQPGEHRLQVAVEPGGDQFRQGGGGVAAVTAVPGHQLAVQRQ